MLYHSPKSACFVAHIFLPFFDGLYTHSDLRKGLPIDALKWMKRSIMLHGSNFPEELLRDRDSKHYYYKNIDRVDDL